MKQFVKINSIDNVAVALIDIDKNVSILVDDKALLLKEDIKRGHKFSLSDINSGENIIKYGAPIGHATKEILCGEWVHSHNMKTNLEGINDYTFQQELSDVTEADAKLTFKGYVRGNGSVGIRNELWIVPTVGCVNGIAETIINRFKKEVKPEGIDAIEVFKHNYGCSQLGDDHANTQAILGDIVKHPNAGGVLVLGLGCENNYISAFKETINEYDEERVKFLVTQEVSNEIEEGLKLLTELYEKMKKAQRVETSISELKIGLKCGGSDGLSGITANPLLGAFSDLLISQGGTTVLTEVPEMFGAETILMSRAVDKNVFNQTVELINNFKQYFIEHKQPVYENPSPGNKEGGITTLEEKSLGCTQKGGKAMVVDVLKYGEIINKKGLNLLNSPGNDLVAATALGASGCQMVLFTTGRGTPFGSFVPTMKISTNSHLFNLKPHWIDFNAGGLVEDASMEEVLEQFLHYIIKVASGELVNNEKNNFREIAIFKTGVTL
ncbi:UxaA family hydrolase [Alkaliphilus peptidifermentans]|uniref:D-altronate dehydratase n=1 Tax=Alkaliphilus peptidifermentans DSM 18978 TaxID=1120976 RepID=A0A1G5F0M9_9FIRM|nr:altronate dehydratase family protein [Alkaliphilus peptidifermentans]SCY32767.1 D-altronate dehydratase [Alkaliphilus peptidifermentans DSM 18978]